MDILLVALHVLFLVPLYVRAARWREGGERAGILGEIAASFLRPALMLHGAGLLLLWAGMALALAGGRVPREPTIRGVLGAVVLAGGAALMAWALATFRSWRLLPKIGAEHELCTSGPYRFVRHPIYLAIDLLGAGTAIWVGGPLTIAGVALVAAFGDRRARLEEKVLIEAFGDRYRDYMRRTRRTIPLLY